ncbi:helix-turn-helix domain-containing protein [Sphaerisporangium dianthi]|uniref:Helix-turn-helix domain-containing protein n=1 Tax=Sphaerisporangium dianthi TaxID=1436120 RepID=A0ABV9CSC5_9ACTN
MNERWHLPEQYTHGPGVEIPARICAWLESHAGLARLRIERRGQDPEVDAVLAAIRQQAARWRTSATGSPDAAQPEVAPSSTWLTTTQAGDLLGMTDRGVRDAIEGGRLPAENVAGRWRISREDVEHYRARRGAA